MLKSITINYEARDFFGGYCMRQDVVEGTNTWPISTKHVDRAIKRLTDTDKGFAVAHFLMDDGQLWTAWPEGGPDPSALTVRHLLRWNSADEDASTDARMFRNMMRAACKPQGSR